MSPEFLTVEDVLEIQAQQLATFGGASGIRDRGLLESAVAQPMATFGGTFLHADLFEMAAAYLFHIVQNHPFMDGNKRTGLLAALVFLDLNGISIQRDSPTLLDTALATAKGTADKKAIAIALQVAARQA